MPNIPLLNISSAKIGVWETELNRALSVEQQARRREPVRLNTLCGVGEQGNYERGFSGEFN